MKLTSDYERDRVVAVLFPPDGGLVLCVLPSANEAFKTMKTVRRMADSGKPITEVRNAMLKSS